MIIIMIIIIIIRRFRCDKKPGEINKSKITLSRWEGANGVPNCQLNTNFSANCQLTTIFLANCQLTTNLS